MTKYISKRIFFTFITFILIISFVYIISVYANLAIWLRGYSKLEILKFAWFDFKIYAEGIITDFDFGTYNMAGKPVLTHVLEEIPTTFKINLYAFILYMPLGILLGFLTAYYKNSWFDRCISYITLVLGSVPGYVTMLFLMLYFGYQLGWFPGRFDPSPDNPWSFIQSITLPVLALSAGPVSRFTRILRGELIESMDSEYLLLLRMKGLNKRQMMVRHAFKNSIPPLVTDIPRTFSLVLSMSFIIEITYNIRGAAFLLYESFITPSLDGNYLQIDAEAAFVICGFYIGLVMLMSLVSDISQAFIDPRVQMGSKKTNQNS